MKKGILHIYIRVSLALLLSTGFMMFAYAIQGPGAAWQNVRKITLSAATPLTNFQVKVTLTTGQYTNMNATGNDLRFYDINNNVCNYWIETWNNAGASTIWVNVPSNGATALYMYYGNAAAGAVSNGTTTFEFFDDFPGASLNANWTTITTNGTVTVSGNKALIVNTTGGTNNGGAGIYSTFTPQSTSFIIEAKHNEPAYNRNRFYALDATNPSGNGGSNSVVGLDYGFFINGTTPQIFWNASEATVSVNTDYLTRWDITDGTNTTYKWSNYLYSTGAQISTNSTTLTKTIRFLCFRVTEQASTSTTVDWARVRKAGVTEPLGSAGGQLANLTASITSQTDVLCNGKSTGSATVTAIGGQTPYTYSWNSSPTQTTQAANNLPPGIYTVTVTDNNGLTITATATITQPVAVISTATSNNINCFNAGDGQIIVTGSSGISPYMFSINNGTTYQAGSTFSSLPIGSYKPRVKDNNGCESKSVQ